MIDPQLLREHGQAVGSAVTLLSAFLCAAYIVFTRKYRADTHVVVFSFAVFAVASVVQAAVALVLNGGISIGNTWTQRAAVLALVLLPTIGGHTLSMFLLRHAHPGMLAETPYMVDFDPEIYFSWDVVYPLLSLALICSCLCFSLWAICIKHLGVARSGNFIAITPVFTALLCWILGRECLSLMQWIGIVIAIGGLVLTQHTGRLRIPRLFLKRRFLR